METYTLDQKNKKCSISYAELIKGPEYNKEKSIAPIPTTTSHRYRICHSWPRDTKVIYGKHCPPNCSVLMSVPLFP